ncbi:MAG: ABC transporter permease [Candidatus Aquicultorales bacterium]
MVNVARRNLFQAKLRFVISSGGVALAIMLILVLNGFYAGMNRQVTAYLDNIPGDLVVTQRGIKNFLGTTSSIPLTDLEKVEQIDGVRRVIPVLASYVVLDIKGKKVFTLMIGYDREKGGGPWQMEAGSSTLGDDEVVFDATLAANNHLKLGDDVKILGKRFKISGLSGGASSWMTGTFFLTYESAAALRKEAGRATALLVSMEVGASSEAVADRIREEAGGTTVTPKFIVERNDINLFAGVFSGPLRFMVTVAFLIGLLLVGFTIYTATVERAREYGMLKAIGTKNRKLYRIVLEQALIASLAGSVAGLALAFIARGLITSLAPQFLISIEVLFVLLVVPIAVVMALLASFLPVRTIAAIDPAIAFRRGA